VVAQAEMCLLVGDHGVAFHPTRIG
jgi:hypothetical protein